MNKLACLTFRYSKHFLAKNHLPWAKVKNLHTSTKKNESTNAGKPYLVILKLEF